MMKTNYLKYDNIKEPYGSHIIKAIDETIIKETPVAK